MLAAAVSASQGPGVKSAPDKTFSQQYEGTTDTLCEIVDEV
ncbi:MAG: hypothetical protein U0N69_02690 [Senegalimassilia anaerobia]